MALNRLAICARNSFRKRLFTNYNVGSIFSFTRSLSSSAEGKGLETSEKNASPFTTSRAEIDDLSQMRSKIRALHGITETSENYEIVANHRVEQSVTEAEFDYFQDGINAVGQEANDDLKRKEVAFINHVLVPKKPVENVEITFYGKITRDTPIQKVQDQSDRSHIPKRFEEAKTRRDFNQVHGNVKKDSFNSKGSSVNYFDEQYFDLPSDKVNNKHLPRKKDPEPDSFIEEQYFSSKHSEDGSAVPHHGAPWETSELPPNPPLTEEKWSNDDTDNLNFFDQKFFDKSDNKVSSEQKPLRNEKNRSSKSRQNKPKELSNEERFSLKSCDDEIRDFNRLPPFSFDLDDLKSGEESTPAEDDNNTRIENFTRKEIKSLKSRKVSVEQPHTAYEAVVKMRLERGFLPSDEDEKRQTRDSPGRWDGKRDSKGFRILSSQTQDLQKSINMDLVSMLCDSILFENEELLAINKPYGLPSQGGPGATKSVASLLESMAARREKNIGTYHIVHRLDKETTGIMLLAKTEKTAKRLTQMFLKRQVVKLYWAITKGIPNPPEGIIDIPIGEESIDNKYRMNLAPAYAPDMRSPKEVLNNISNAVTHYKVLDSNEHSALVECRPESGLKHQIRCHLAFGLNTPILGDHKYSHTSRIAPQRLSPEILRKLGIRQAKVRHLAMHLHARSLVLPNFLPDGRNLFISAHIPPHFSQNMKWLKLRFDR